MNKQNTYELLVYLLEWEGRDFLKKNKPTYSILLVPDVEIEEAQECIEWMEQDLSIRNEDNEPGHIYYNCLVLLKDFLNES